MDSKEVECGEEEEAPRRARSNHQREEIGAQWIDQWSEPARMIS